MSERLTPERLSDIRRWCLAVSLVSEPTLSQQMLGELLAELDAVTRERDEALEKLKGSGSYSGMNFITNRDGRTR
jgi:hypothetical protein